MATTSSTLDPKVKSGPISRFLAWWVGELRALANLFVPGRPLPRRPGAIISLTDREIHVSRLQRDGEAQDISIPVGSDPPGDLKKAIGRTGPTRLRLTAEQALVHVIELPAAAERSLHQILTLQMPRRTPFRPDQVRFDFDVMERSARDSTIKVWFGVAPNHLIDGLISRLASWGVQVEQVDIEGLSADQSRRIDLMRQESAPSPGVFAGINAILAVAILIFAASLAALPFFDLYERREALLEKTALAETQVRYVTALRSKIDAIEQANRFLEKKRAAYVPAVAVVSEVSRALPDGSWLDHLSLSKDIVVMQGFSRNAAGLIAAIENSDLFSGAKFRGSITQVENAPQERFQIATEVRVLSADAASKP